MSEAFLTPHIVAGTIEAGLLVNREEMAEAEVVIDVQESIPASACASGHEVYRVPQP